MRSIWLFAVVVGLCAISAAPAPPLIAAETTWYSILDGDGARVGHAVEQVENTPTGRRITGSQEVTVSEPGGPSTAITDRTVVTEDAAGRTVSILNDARTGDGKTRTMARISGDEAVVSRQTSAGEPSTTVHLPAGVRFDDGEALLRTWDFTTHPRLEFDGFDTSAAAVNHVVIETIGSAPTDPEGGASLIRRRYNGSELVSLSRLRLDAGHRIVETIQPMFGAVIVIRRTDRDTALKSQAALRLLPTEFIKSPYRIPDSALQGHIRYRFGFKEGMAFAIPQTGEQSVANSPDGVVIDICAACGPGLATDPGSLADAMKSTAWMQSDSVKIRRLAAPVARLHASDTRKMELLTKQTVELLPRLDTVGHYSALDALQRGAGDCTESAVLLGALGRAAGIPTRVVNGVAYSREPYFGVGNAFIPHSWVVAYVDGKWRSFDAALLSFDNTHIALNVGDGDEQSILVAGQLASLLRWDGMSEVKTRPGS